MTHMREKSLFILIILIKIIFSKHSRFHSVCLSLLNNNIFRVVVLVEWEKIPRSILFLRYYFS